MIHSTNGILFVQNNNFLYNGNFESGLPLIAVKNGASVILENSFNHLYCRNACLLILLNSNSVIQGNTISNIAGPSIILDNSKLTMQD